MNMLTLTTLIIAASVRHAVAFVLDYESTQICIPDSKFLYDHNICKCNSEGTGIVCDRSVYSSVLPSLHKTLLQNVTIECLPTKIFNFGCKTCLCDESGQYATCVRDNCGDYDFGPETPDRCLPGSVFAVDDYNGCICGADGKAACTRLEFDPSGNTQKPHCVPNSSGFRFECNNCECSSKGEMTCSRMGCSPLEFQHENLLNITIKCEAKSIFDYNCHECVCGDGGNYAMCYGKQCWRSIFDETTVIRDTKKNCIPGMVFGDKCNVCICDSNSQGACTTLNCDIDYRFDYKN